MATANSDRFFFDGPATVWTSAVKISPESVRLGGRSANVYGFCIMSLDVPSYDMSTTTAATNLLDEQKNSLEGKLFGAADLFSGPCPLAAVGPARFSMTSRTREWCRRGSLGFANE